MKKLLLGVFLALLSFGAYADVKISDLPTKTTVLPGDYFYLVSASSGQLVSYKISGTNLSSGLNAFAGSPMLSATNNFTGPNGFSLSLKTPGLLSTNGTQQLTVSNDGVHVTNLYGNGAGLTGEAPLFIAGYARVLASTADISPFLTNYPTLTGSNRFTGTNVFYSTGLHPCAITGSSDSGSGAIYGVQTGHFESPVAAFQRIGGGAIGTATSPVLSVIYGNEAQLTLPVFKVWGCTVTGGDNGLLMYPDGSLYSSTGLLDKELLLGGVLSVDSVHRQLLRSDNSILDWAASTGTNSILTQDAGDSRYVNLSSVSGLSVDHANSAASVVWSGISGVPDIGYLATSNTWGGVQTFTNAPIMWLGTYQKRVPFIGSSGYLTHDAQFYYTNHMLRVGGTSTPIYGLDLTGTTAGADSFHVTGGSSGQFMKADGSLDANRYSLGPKVGMVTTPQFVTNKSSGSFTDSSQGQVALTSGTWDVKIHAILASTSGTVGGTTFYTVFTGSCQNYGRVYFSTSSGTSMQYASATYGSETNLASGSMFSAGQTYGSLGSMAFTAEGIVIVATSGTLKMQFSQYTATTSGSSVIYPGSFIRATQVNLN